MKYLTTVLSLLMLSTSVYAYKLDRGDNLMFTPNRIYVENKYIIEPDCVFPITPNSNVTLHVRNSRVYEGRTIKVRIDDTMLTCKVNSITAL